MDRLTSLDAVRNHVWTRLEEAAEDPGHAFRALTFGTAQSETPHLRTVVLRRVEAEARVLAFHSNRYAQKIDDIRANDRIAWHGWDPDTLEQVRLQGRATVHTDDAVADDLWAAEDPASLDLYVRTDRPGTALDAPDDGLQPSVTSEPVTREDVAPGRDQFAVVRTVINEIDWLHLHPEGHYRARFQFDTETDAFEGTWVVP